MEKNFVKKCVVFTTIALLVGIMFGSTINAGILENKQIQYISIEKTANINLNNGYTNITVNEAWGILSDTSNGIQIPVDVRRDDEWAEGFIDTPYPESPIHYRLALLQDPAGLEEFIEMYDGEEIIVYCAKGGRSQIACEILVDAGFSGSIYNMLGGTTAWENVGLPMRGNEAPNIPTITGKETVKVGKEYEYTFVASDPNEDGVRYYIDWGDNNTKWTQYYYSDEEAKIKHAWDVQNNYTIQAKTQDFYGNESDWATLTVTVPVNYLISYHSSKLLFFKIISSNTIYSKVIARLLES